MRKKTLTPRTIDLDEENDARLDNPALHIEQRLNVRFGFALTDSRRITRKKNVKFVIDYPVDGEWEFKATSSTGWTVAKVVRKIQALYQKRIYRNTDKYGVWGHGIGDLVIERVYYNNGVFTFSIGS
jgi:hypothetical protein